MALAIFGSRLFLMHQRASHTAFDNIHLLLFFTSLLRSAIAHISLKITAQSLLSRTVNICKASRLNFFLNCPAWTTKVIASTLHTLIRNPLVKPLTAGPWF